jgi:hypothetical protein
MQKDSDLYRALCRAADAVEKAHVAPSAREAQAFYAGQGELLHGPSGGGGICTIVMPQKQPDGSYHIRPNLDGTYDVPADGTPVKLIPRDKP